MARQGVDGERADKIDHAVRPVDGVRHHNIQALLAAVRHVLPHFVGCNPNHDILEHHSTGERREVIPPRLVHKHLL